MTGVSTRPTVVPDRPPPAKASRRDRGPNDPVALTASMVDVLFKAHVFAPAATPIVLHGETGTGKTYIAEYIHQVSGRGGEFHAFSVGTVAPQLALDELFGHVEGAYTDARRMRPGRIPPPAGGRCCSTTCRISTSACRSSCSRCSTGERIVPWGPTA